MRIISITLLICFLSCFSLAQTDGKVVQKLDDYFADLAKEGEINGSVLIAENGRVVYQKSFGYADFEAKRLNTEASEFDLGSISKTFTATAVLQLKEKDKLNLDDKFVKYFPAFPYSEITIRQMLSHTSGLPNFELFDKLISENPERVFENKDIIPALIKAKTPLKFEPGEKWSYGNFNFALLALLIEKLSGEKIQDYFRKNIFKPARMMSSYVKSGAVNPSDTPHLAYGYIHRFLYSSDFVNVNKTLSEPAFKNIIFHLGFIGAGNVHSTTGDMLKFDQALENGILLKNETLEEAFTPTKLKSGEINKPPPGFGGLGVSSNGLGWFILDDTQTGKIVWHGGGRPGSVTIILRNLTKKQTVIVLDNITSAGLYRKGLSAMNILNGKPVLTVKKSLARIYGRTLLAKGADSAAVRLNELKADTENYNLSEDELNNMAYEMMDNNLMSQALETLKLNTFLFPASDNVYESYGDALLRTGKKQESIAMFKKALQINPDNKYALENLKKAESQK